MDLATIALIIGMGVQEGNPCQRSLTAVQNNPDQLAFHIEDLDRLKVTTIEYVIFLNNGSIEPQGRGKPARRELQDTPFPFCYTLDWTPPPNLIADGSTQYVVVARTENAQGMVSSWGEKSNPFNLGTPPDPDPEPLPLPVPGVRVGKKSQ